jgi:hypothetical protein
MGIRKSYGKNKKDKRPALAIAVKREETVRRAARSTQRPRAGRGAKAPARPAAESRAGGRRARTAARA